MLFVFFGGQPLHGPHLVGRRQTHWSVVAGFKEGLRRNGRSRAAPALAPAQRDDPDSALPPVSGKKVVGGAHRGKQAGGPDPDDDADERAARQLLLLITARLDIRRA